MWRGRGKPQRPADLGVEGGGLLLQEHIVVEPRPCLTEGLEACLPGPLPRLLLHDPPEPRQVNPTPIPTLRVQGLGQGRLLVGGRHGGRDLGQKVTKQTAELAHGGSSRGNC